MELIATYWPYLAGLLATGFIAGVLAGLLGVGGGIVVVPVLYIILTALGMEESVRMHVAVGTSLATIIPTSMRSLSSHAKRGAVQWDVLKGWGPGLFIGTLIGTALAGLADAEILQLVFGVIAFGVAMNMAFGPTYQRDVVAVPRGAKGFSIGTGIGTLSAMMGIGGGTLGVPILTYCGLLAQKAVATASGFGLIISIPGAIGFAVTGWDVANLPPTSLGYVNLAGFALISPMTVLSAPLGVAAAHALPTQRLKQAFALFLAITAAKMIYDFLV
ncbi:MAG: sulfite exporter TauE/SafE family protein [Pseudomonadota bacterium]